MSVSLTNKGNEQRSHPEDVISAGVSSELLVQRGRGVKLTACSGRNGSQLDCDTLKG